MAIGWLESFDAIDTSLLGAKGWVVTGAPTVSTTTPRTGTRCLDCGAAGRYVTHNLASGATQYVGFAFRTASLALGGDLSISQTICGFYGEAGTRGHLALDLSTTGGLVAYRKNNNADRWQFEDRSDNSSFGGVTVGSAGAVIAVDTWYYIEIKVVCHDTTGQFVVKVNGNTVINATNVDTSNGGTAVFDTLYLGKGYGPTAYQGFDDVYSSTDAHLGDIGVHALLPTGNGNSSQLLGSDADSTDNYALVDEAPGSTADYVGSATDNQKDTYVFANLSPSSGSVKAVQFAALAQKTDAGARSVAFVTRHSGTDYDTADVPLSTAYTYATKVEELNPGTAAAWTKADVDAAEFGVKIRP